MECVAKFVGTLGLLTYLSGVSSLAERKRTLEDEVDYCNAKMLDIEREITWIRRGKKRKRDDILCGWKAKGRKLIDEAQCLLGQVGRWRCFVMGAKVRWDVWKLVYAFKVHHMQGHVLLRQASSDARGPCCGFHLPVKQLVGQVASSTLNQLKLLLEGDEVGRIAVHGIEGVGKTFLMKHLHNLALNKFDYVFWVLSPVDFTIKSVQDALAEVVYCNFSSDDASSVRARKLSDTFTKLGSFAIFLDGVPKADFSLEQVGIPVPAEGSECKLAITTSSTTLGCKMLDSFEKVKIPSLPKEDAYELFMHKANIGRESVSSLDGIPFSLADRCCGVPSMIENIATCMWGLDDPCEWKIALCEFDGPGMKKRSRLFHLGENETTTCIPRLG